MTVAESLIARHKSNKNVAKAVNSAAYDATEGVAGKQTDCIGA